MTLDDILDEWKLDSQIDQDLSESSRLTPELHAKYLSMFAQAKLKLKQE